MKMTILDRDDEITHIVLTGRLDTTGVVAIEQSFSAVTAAQGRSAIVDLSDIDFMASRGIGLLLANGKRLKAAGHRMVLLNPREMVESILRASRVEQLLPIAHDLEEALQVLLGIPGPSATAPPVAAPDRSRPRGSEVVSAPVQVSEGELRLSIKNEVSELESLSATVARFLSDHGVPYRPTYAVNLAIDELVTNVMRYAYVDDDTHMIDIELLIEDDQVILRIIDDGRPFDPRRGPALDLHAEDREVGKLGLLLVLEMVDALKYRRADERNWVEIRVQLTGGEAVDGGTPATEEEKPSQRHGEP